ncbi:MAG: carboxymuconolactone decarboxylase family protein [Rhizobiales bacterium]|jgi:AhpD family alkylhydroperoxidase|nr:carboxymuconolactone decarboxylase family protein [Hyphomicrobiales bacterium]
MTQRLDYEHISPGGMKALGGVYMHVANSGLGKNLVDLVYLRVSQINGCAYCIDMHTRDLASAKTPLSKIALVSVWRETGTLFTERERAALEWAETLTLVSQTHAPESTYRAVAQHFSEKEIVDLTIAIGLMNTYNRIAIGFGRGPANVDMQNAA